MKAAIKYIKPQLVEEEIEPVRVILKFNYAKITMPDGSERTADVPIGQENYAFIEDGNIRFKHQLEFRTK
jgi:hypothetical protein